MIMLGIRGKLNIALGTMIALLLAVFLIASTVFSTYSDAVERMGVDDLDSVIAARDMHNAVGVLYDAAQDSLRTGKTLDEAWVEESSSSFDQALAVQLSRVTLPGEQQLTADIQTKWGEILRVTSMVKDAPAEDRTTVIQGRLIPAIRGLRPLLTQLSQLNADNMKARHAKLGSNAKWVRWELRGTILLALIAAAGFSIVLGRRMTSSLRAMTAAAKAMASGDLEQRLTVSGRDEFGQFVGVFNQMAAELRRFRALDADKLERSYQTTQTAIDSLPDGVILVNEHGKVELANKTATRLFGIRAGQENLQDFAAWLREAIERPSPTLDSYGSSITIDDGAKHRYFLPQSVSLRNSEDRAIGTTIILTDVTDFRRLDELKDSLLSMASHELKTPLTSMRIILPLLLEQNVGSLNDKQVDLLKVVCNATERMRAIVENILDIGRMASGKMPMNMKTVTPAELIAKAVATQQTAYAQGQVTLYTDVPGDLPPVRCDPVQIDLVLNNLLGNALQYSSSAGKVAVSAVVYDDTVTFSVKDNGCGIDAVHLPRIFETFFRVPGQRSDSGTGLGLALVKQIVEAHGGRVGVESVVGQGTTFSFTLPLVKAEEVPGMFVNTNSVVMPADTDLPSQTGAEK